MRRPLLVCCVIFAARQCINSICISPARGRQKFCVGLPSPTNSGKGLANDAEWSQTVGSLITMHFKERTMSMAKTIWFGVLVAFGAVMAASTGFAQQWSGVRIEGQVQAGGGPLANSTVTLWAATGRDRDHRHP